MPCRRVGACVRNAMTRLLLHDESRHISASQHSSGQTFAYTRREAAHETIERGCSPRTVLRACALKLRGISSRKVSSAKGGSYHLLRPLRPLRSGLRQVLRRISSLQRTREQDERRAVRPRRGQKRPATDIGRRYDA